MAKPLYNQPLTPNEDNIYPIYPEFYDSNSMDHNDAAATSQPPPVFSATFESNGSFPRGLDYGPVDVDMTFPSLLPVSVQSEEHGLQHQTPWYYPHQAYPALVGDTMAMGDHMSQYASVQDSIGG